MKLFYYLFFVSILMLSWSCEEKNNITDVKDQVNADSLKADSIQKENQVDIVGLWDIQSYAGVVLEQGVMQIDFQDDQIVKIITPKNTHEGNFELDEAGKIISVVEDKKPEEWLIKSYSPQEMIIEVEDHEERIDIVMKRAKEKELAEEK